MDSLKYAVAHWVRDALYDELEHLERGGAASVRAAARLVRAESQSNGG